MEGDAARLEAERLGPVAEEHEVLDALARGRVVRREPPSSGEGLMTVMQASRCSGAAATDAPHRLPERLELRVVGVRGRDRDEHDGRPGEQRVGAGASPGSNPTALN